MVGRLPPKSSPYPLVHSGPGQHVRQMISSRRGENIVNDIQQRVAQVTGGPSGIGHAVIASARGGANIGNRALEFSLPDQGHVDENSRELLRQGTVIANFFRGRW